MSTNVLTGEQIREAARNSRIERAPLVVPELGGVLYVRGMSGKERDRFEEGIRSRKGKRNGLDMRNFRAQLAVQVIVDEQGARLLNDGDVEVIGKLPAGVLDRIIAKCQSLSGKTDEEVDDMGNDSATGDGAASSSSSPSN